jgi:hypothetical protein
MGAVTMSDRSPTAPETFALYITDLVASHKPATLRRPSPCEVVPFGAVGAAGAGSLGGGEKGPVWCERQMPERRRSSHKRKTPMELELR